MAMAETNRERLTTLLSYLIDHNRDHARELRELAQKTAGIRKSTLRDNILEAAQLLDKSTDSLNEALSALRKG